jgi:glucose 1-dehydrogenase
VSRLFGDVADAFGGLDLLVSTAGTRRDRSLLECSLEDWEAVLRVNLTAHFLCAREAARRFLAQARVGADGGRAGAIVCVCPMLQPDPLRTRASEAATKAGVLRLVQSLARELAPYRIRVNGVAPGVIRTPENKADWDSPAAEASALDLIPFGRLGSVGDLGRAVVWLASDEADYVTGAILPVDGGMALTLGDRNGG